ncbi:MAG: hypothetical protein ACI4A5_04525 [Hominilimicola sp.]
MKLTNGTDTIVLTDAIQIRAYLSSGYTEVKEKPVRKRGAKNGGNKA